MRGGLIAIAILCVGCSAAPEHVRALPRWSIAGRELALPAHLDETGRVVLQTEIELSREEQGVPLTFVIPALLGEPRARANGAPLWPMADARPYPRQHAFIVPASAGERLRLEIEIDRKGRFSGWIDEVPRLSTSAGGDRSFRRVRFASVWSSAIALGFLGAGGILYALLFSFDRRRTAFGWFALQVSLVSPFLALEAGLLPLPALPVATAAIAFATFANLRFTEQLFRVAPPRGSIPVLAVIAILSAATVFWPMFEHVGTSVAGGIVMLVGAHQIVRATARMRRGDQDRLFALGVVLAWVFVLVFGVPEYMQTAGLGTPFGGVVIGGIGIALYTLIYGAGLGLSHVRALDRASRLNKELQRQIAERSRQLGAALARVGAIPAQAFALTVGTVIQGRYRVERALGSGGMGVVFEVVRLEGGQHLALKVLTRATSGRELARLAREAETAALVSHPNLVSVVDVDISEDGALYIVMELVDGGSLEDRRKRFGDLDFAHDVIAALARGLAALHDAGIVHRDLKPGNVLVDRDDRVRIADFGIARLHESKDEPAVESTIDPIGRTAIDSPQLTVTGALLGTPLYMAPELARGAEQGTQASDIFAFGVIAWELLVGKYPFVTPPVFDVLLARTPAPPPVMDRDTPLAAMVRRCLEPDPSARPTAHEVGILAERCARRRL